MLGMENAIQVKLIDSMGSDLTVVNTARVSFNKKSDWEDVEEVITYNDKNEEIIYLKHTLKEKDKRLIRFLAREKHITPFRHPQLQLWVKVPIFIARQLAKHQTGFSWNEVSRRYVDSEPEFYIPDCWRKRPDDGIKQGSSNECVETLSDVQDTTAVHAYRDTLTTAVETYNSMIKAGVAPEMARMVLPQSMLTEFIWTGSLYGFFNVYKQRIDSHAQKEAQYFAELLNKVIPDSMKFSWETLKEFN